VTGTSVPSHDGTDGKSVGIVSYQAFERVPEKLKVGRSVGQAIYKACHVDSLWCQRWDASFEADDPATRGGAGSSGRVSVS
jgi:hypothetical protein